MWKRSVKVLFSHGGHRKIFPWKKRNWCQLWSQGGTERRGI